MKSLTRVHQTSDDFIVANTAYTWYPSFWSTTIDSSI